jgi:hypothetical protein
MHPTFEFILTKDYVSYLWHKNTCDLSYIQFANSHISLSPRKYYEKIMLKLEMASNICRVECVIMNVDGDQGLWRPGLAKFTAGGLNWVALSRVCRTIGHQKAQFIYVKPFVGSIPEDHLDAAARLMEDTAMQAFKDAAEPLHRERYIICG